RIPQPVPTPPLYHPESMTREQYRAAIGQYMSFAEASWRASAELAGERFVRVPSSRARHSMDPLRRYRWLAQYQAGLPRAQIAARFDVTRNAVRDAIDGLAKELLLMLRAEPTGRPRRRRP